MNFHDFSSVSSHLFCVVLGFVFFLKSPSSWNWVNTSKSQLLLKAPSPDGCRGKSQLLKMLQVVIQRERCIPLPYFWLLPYSNKSLWGEREWGEVVASDCLGLADLNGAWAVLLVAAEDYHSRAWVEMENATFFTCLLSLFLSCSPISMN